jgi:hypothetical protein
LLLMLLRLLMLLMPVADSAIYCCG